MLATLPSSKETVSILESSGASLTALTVSVINASLVKSPSLAIKVNESIPLKFSKGV